jgi:hypothetical protein
MCKIAFSAGQSWLSIVFSCSVPTNRILHVAGGEGGGGGGAGGGTAHSFLGHEEAANPGRPA